MERLVRYNSWLSQEVTDQIDGRKKRLIDVQSYRIRNALTGSTLDILASDAAT